MKKAIVFGSTGLVGNDLTHIVTTQNYYSRVICFVRKKSDAPVPNAEYIITDFSDLNAHSALFTNADVYCCLGTTIKAVGYDKEKFREADLYRPLLIAEVARSANADQVLVISAMGANQHSSIFYNRVKGELEAALHALNLNSLHILHPSLLVGPRKKIRRGEKFAKAISAVITPLMIGGLRNYRPILSKDVALAMFVLAKKNMPGEHIWNNGALQRLSNNA